MCKNPEFLLEHCDASIIPLCTWSHLYSAPAFTTESDREADRPGRSICWCTCTARAVRPGSSALQSSSETQTTGLVNLFVCILCLFILSPFVWLHSLWTVQPEQSSSPGHWLRWSAWCQRSTCNKDSLSSTSSTSIKAALMRWCRFHSENHTVQKNESFENQQIHL